MTPEPAKSPWCTDGVPVEVRGRKGASCMGDLLCL